MSHRLLSASIDSKIKLWNIEDGIEIGTGHGHSGLILGASFNKDGTHIVSSSGSGDRSIKVWDAETCNELASFNRCAGSICPPSFSPCGKFVLSPCRRRELMIWDIATGNAVADMKGHGDRVTFASYSFDGSKVISCGDDRTCRVWDAATGRQLYFIRCADFGVIKDAFLNENGDKVVTMQSCTFTLWELLAQPAVCQICEFQGHRERIRSVRWNFANTQLISASDDCSARVWDIVTGEQILQLECVNENGVKAEIRCAQFIIGDRKILTYSLDCTARVWDAFNGAELIIFRNHAAHISFAEICEGYGGDILAITGDRSGTIRVWQVDTGEEQTVLVGHTGTITQLSIHSSHVDYLLK